MSPDADLALWHAAFAARPELPNQVLLPRLDSTQRLARRIVEEYHREYSEPPPMLVSALEQTAGRGRRGNRWQSPAGGGVYATLVLAPVARETLPLLPMAVGVALCEALDPWCDGDGCRLKWPNDVFWRGGKLGGILIETKLGDDDPVALIGFGVNYRRPAEGAPRPAAMADFAAPVPPLEQAAAELSAAVWKAVSRPLDGAAVSAAYGRRSLHREGDEIAWRQGNERITGRFLGFDDSGLLRLEDAATGEERRLAAGEVLAP